jgi:hypothetical protein
MQFRIQEREEMMTKDDEANPAQDVDSANTTKESKPSLQTPGNTHLKALLLRHLKNREAKRKQLKYAPVATDKVM